MVERGLEPEFSPDVLVETGKLGHAAPAADAAIQDLRALPWCSIDNDDSRDLDQLSVTKNESGRTRVLVAVADVDALVKKGSAIDGHARTNTTSVYTAAEIFPMLPEQLSTDLTSLNPGVDRLAIVIDMEISEDGALGASSVYRAQVHNRAKLAYNSVAAWLDTAAAATPEPIARVPGMEEQVRLQDRIAQGLRRRRHERGALSLHTAEARPVFDGERLADLREEQPNRAKQLIEEFMVAANGVTAEFLEGKRFPSLRRVLRSPERWERIVALASGLGGRLPREPDAGALEAFLAERREADPDRFPDLSLSIVKLLGRGEYALERAGEKAEGHFGLAVQDYTHSTAPNRRFPDLITQRLIKAALAGARPPYPDAELAGLAQHCTEQEDNAAKVERRVRKSAAALLLARRIGERFDGIVTGASDKGTWVRITHPAAEGKVVRGFQGLDVGDHVRVELVRADVERGLVDFARGHA